MGNQLSQGEQSTSISDYRSIRDNKKIKFPRNISEVGITLTRFSVLCPRLYQGIGGAHPFVDSMWGLTMGGCRIMHPSSRKGTINLPTPPEWSRCTLHALHAPSRSLQVHDYLHPVSTNVGDGVTGVELPTFRGMLQDLKRGTFHHSTNWITIPDAYLEPVPRGTAPCSVSTAPTGSATTTVSTTCSGMPTLTPDASA